MSRIVKARGTGAGKAAAYHKGCDGDVARLISTTWLQEILRSCPSFKCRGPSTVL